MEDCRKEWKVGRLDAPPPGVGRGLKVVVARPEDRTTSSKTRPKRPIRSRSPMRAGVAEDDRSSGCDDDASADESEEEKNRRHRTRRRKRRTTSRRSSSAPLPKDPAEPEKGERKGEASKKGGVKASPLDAMLNDDGVPDYVQADARFEGLRKPVEDKKKRTSSEKDGADAVLAKRVQAGMEDGKKRKKKESEKERVKKVLKALSSGVKEESRSASSDHASDDDDEEDYLKDSKHGDLMGRQRSYLQTDQVPYC